jgi:hypothetical protein
MASQESIVNSITVTIIIPLLNFSELRQYRIDIFKGSVRLLSHLEVE